MEITIVKGKPILTFSSWYNTTVTYTPVYWAGKDGVQHFITNLPSGTGSDFDEKMERKELDRKIDILKRCGCRFLPVYLKSLIRDFPCEDIEAFLAWKKENGYTFDRDMTDPVRWDEDEKCFNFHGNLREYSAAFWFRIYDKELAELCRKAYEEEGGGHIAVAEGRDDVNQISEELQS